MQGYGLVFAIEQPPMRRRRASIIGYQGWLALAAVSVVTGAVLGFVL